ncbi:Tetratricopeptide-like helical domain containing protein [Parasponia andersonii]|uniref:Tetratricopeptide-like helical domain containing protein n=1 Tax=Parasponia andersonii TaxID=3476 RepID=A0A2P5C283_PARAD|nr:Tetratricopeptide-like helical domain containing protein [Parasponia andersonii]
MDVSFSAKPQILTLISWTPLSSSSSASLSRSLQREFLGCGHNLRPPGGLRHRTRHRKSWSHAKTKSSRFFFRAALGSHSVVLVVAVVTVSAASFVYWNLFRSKKNSREVQRPRNFALPQLGGRGINHVIESEMLELGEFREIEVQQLLKDEKRENRHASLHNEVPLQFHQTAVMNKESVITSALQSPSSSVLVSGSGNSTLLNEPKVLDHSLSPLLAESAMLERLNFVEKLNGLQIEKLQEEIESEFSSASVEENDSLVEVRVHEMEKKELGVEGETINFNSFLGDSEREELHVFYNESKSEGKHIANVNGHKSFSAHASVLDSNAFSKNSIIKGAEISAEVPHIKAENVEGKIPFASYREGPYHGAKDLRKGRGDSRDRRKGHLAQNNYKVLPELPHINGIDVDGKNQTLEQLRVYNRLLKDRRYAATIYLRWLCHLRLAQVAGWVNLCMRRPGFRLSNAVELLEDMEKRGLLDMNKVYHARFFKTCKLQKAVNEAFRFIKLIPNPTLSTYNMLMSVCASSQDSEGAFQVLQLVQESGLTADCKLYTTLISTCAKSGKVDSMFEVFHKMVNAGVEPNIHTYGALIDGCARAGQVAKAFGAYGIMRSKNVKPDRVIFNALITACGQSGAVDRAFDVLAEMSAETQPIDPDHVTIGALIKACANAGQVDRAREVYKMMNQYKIKGTPEVYTIAINSCSQTGDWEFACNVYDEMNRKGVVPDEMFLSALIDAAGHAGKLDAAFEILNEAKNQGVKVGIVSYSSLMGACSNAKNWRKALELYEELKSIKLKQTVSTVNALITALCDGDQLQKAMEVLSEMNTIGLSPNSITYSILLVASEKKDDQDVGLTLYSQAKKDGITPNIVMSRCLVGMCLRRYEKACTLGEPIFSFESGRPEVVNKWTSSALMVYRETVAAGIIPTIDVLSQVLGCLQLPYDTSLKDRLIENLGVSADTSRPSNLCSLIDGFGEYDPRAFSLLEEAASHGIVPCVSFKQSLVVVDTRELQVHAAEVYLLTVLKGLKHRLAAGAKLPSITILLPVEKAQITSPNANEEKTVNLVGRVGQAVAALLRRLGLSYQGNESYGKIRINGLTIKRWFMPKLASPFSGKPEEINLSQFRLGKGIAHQQRNIRTGNLSLD